MTPGPFEQVYAELRKIAAAKLAGESPGHTLDATALVHEAWLKLAGASVAYSDRTHFLRTAATAMRRILVDHARAKAAHKRGGGATRVALDGLAAPDADEQLLALDGALTKLAATKPDHAALLELCHFGGLTGDEAAAALGLSASAADRMARFAKAWLRVEIGD